MKLTIGYLYPGIMSHYGDRGNVICLARRCQWRGIDLEVREIDIGDPVDPDTIDIFLMGGGADSHQRLIAEDLALSKGPALRQAVEEGAAALMICGGYQLWGHFYRTSTGEDLPGVGIFDAYTVHRAVQLGVTMGNITEAGRLRSVDNLVVQWGDTTLVGFENHGGHTYLNPGATPFARVVVGGGNNAEDGTEGCLYRNAIGTYLHGSVLPKNPHLADHLIRAGLQRRYGDVTLEPLEDDIELRAHRSAVDRILSTPRPLSSRLAALKHRRQRQRAAERS